DRVHDRANEREQRGGGGAADEHGVLDSPLRILVGPVHQRQPDDDQEEQQQIDGKVEAVVLYPKERERHGLAGWSRSRPDRHASVESTRGHELPATDQVSAANPSSL